MSSQLAHRSQSAPSLLVRTVRSSRRLDSGREYRIGRDSAADLPLSDPRASWNHAVLRAEGPVWVLEDVGSRNGTFLGIRRITRLEITRACTVHFGHPEDGPVMSFELEVPAAQSAFPSAPATLPPFRPASPAGTTSVPGVLREPTTRLPIRAHTLTIGRHRDNDIVIEDIVVSKRHAELRRTSAGRYLIIDLGSHNGTYVNGTRVNEAELGEEDIVAIGHATFRLVGGELVEYVDDGRATFEAHGLRVVVSEGGRQKVLLDGITFPLAERSLMAVIGPAGAGKSTLLNALTGKRPATEGSVCYDFRDLYENYDELRHRIGLVPQESVIHDQLTPQSALGYQAELRFPPDTGADERSQRVTEVLEELSMTPHKDTRIDRLSGGQRKRVNIGLELLTRPTLLFLDEPTSPLDPHLKRQMFEQMRRMADPDSSTGQSVIVITHDVDARLIGMCDRLIVLQPGGKMAYFGPPAEGLRYFGKQDWADVFQAFEDQPGRDWAGEYRASPEFAKYVAAPISVRQRQPETGLPEDRQQQPPRQRSGLSQVLTMARRYRRVMWADRVFMATTVLMPVLLGLLVKATPTPLGLVNGTGAQAGGNLNAIQVLMILVMSSVLSGTALSIREFIKERDIYERERMAGLSAAAYLMSKILVLAVISILQTLLIVLVGVATLRLPPSGVVLPVAIVEIYLALAVLSVVSMLIGLAISALVTRGDQTMPILVGVTMIQVALSGGLFSVTGALNGVSMIAPARWGMAALASTINLNMIQAQAYLSTTGQKPDAMWAHSASHWITAIAVMAGLGLAWTAVARLRLAAIGPRRRRQAARRV